MFLMALPLKTIFFLVRLLRQAVLTEEVFLSALHGKSAHLTTIGLKKYFLL